MNYCDKEGADVNLQTAYIETMQENCLNVKKALPEPMIKNLLFVLHVQHALEQASPWTLCPEQPGYCYVYFGL